MQKQTFFTIACIFLLGIGIGFFSAYHLLRDAPESSDHDEPIIPTSPNIWQTKTDASPEAVEDELETMLSDIHDSADDTPTKKMTPVELFDALCTIYPTECSKTSWSDDIPLDTRYLYQ